MFRSTACHCQKSYGIEPTWRLRVGLISPLKSYVMSQNLTGLIVRHDDGLLWTVKDSCAVGNHKWTNKINK